MLTKNKLYTYLAIACMTGYSWVFIIKLVGSANTVFNVCLMKQLTNIPCPSCGATRSLLSFLNGNFIDALFLNPIGILLLIIMVILPLWLTVDILCNKQTLFAFYHKMEYTLKQKYIAAPAILIVLANWIWNIFKQL